MNYVQIWQAIQDYSSNTESLFVNNIPTFVQQAEQRIYNTVQLASLRKNVTGVLTSGNQYLSLPTDWLANYSIATIDSSGNFNYLINKDVNFIREAYPTVAGTGLPKYYALFGSQYTSQNELSVILGPTPDQSYNIELHYFFYPPSIVQGIISTFGSITAGIGYTNGVYENIPLTGGSGSGATATFLIVGTAVSAVTINNGGNFYVAGDILSVNPSSIGAGTGSSFSIPIATTNNSTGQSWLGDNFDPVLFYGAMREAILFMKGEQDLVKYYEDKYNESLLLLKRLGDGLDRGDAYRDNQTKLMVDK